jgi:hypothetical protein
MVLKSQKVRLGAYAFQESSDLLYFHRVPVQISSMPHQMLHSLLAKA